MTRARTDLVWTEGQSSTAGLEWVRVHVADVRLLPEGARLRITTRTNHGSGYEAEFVSACWQEEVHAPGPRGWVRVTHLSTRLDGRWGTTINVLPPSTEVLAELDPEDAELFRRARQSRRARSV